MRLTSLYRSVAPWHGATLWMWVALVIVGVSTTISHGLHHGIRGALEVMLAWMITRELAPRRAWASALAPFLVIPFAIPSHTDLLACFVVLIAARVASRSTGDAPTPLDVLVMLALVFEAAHRPAGLPVAVVLAALTFAAAPPRWLRFGGVAALAVALVVGTLEGNSAFRPGWDDPNTAEQVLLALAAAAAALLLVVPLPARLRVTDDRRRGALHGSRVRGARIAVVASVVATVAWTGTDGAFALSSACAALIAAAIGGATLRSGTISP